MLEFVPIRLREETARSSCTLIQYCKYIIMLLFCGYRCSVHGSATVEFIRSFPKKGVDTPIRISETIEAGREAGSIS